MQVYVCFGFHFTTSFNTTKAPETLRVLSWNLSSWGKTSKGNSSMTSYRTEMINEIINMGADVLCFQEFPFSKAANYNDSIVPELKEQGYKFSYFVRSKYELHLYKSANVTGVAILSKYPVIDSNRFYYNKEGFTEPLIYADINFNNKIIRVFTTHLQSIRLENYDYDALYSLKKPSASMITKSRGILWKIKQGYIKRSGQAELLHEKIKASPNPAIVCGDFNDVPNSYTYFTASENLQDAFLKKGAGFGRTYRFISPTLRIDYILADKKFTVNQYQKKALWYSDHYPIMADITVTEKN
jgi:endonuclease/exonuclease/phosphatase family metal-dependent hydrolase